MSKTNRIQLDEIHDHLNKTVTIAAWVNSVRDQKAVQFIILRDKNMMLQAVRKKADRPNKLSQTITELTPESVVEITGKLTKNKDVKLHGVELIIDELNILSQANPMLPIEDESSLEKRLDWRFLDLRHPRNRLIFEVETTVEQAMRDYWKKHNFIEIHTPKLMDSPSETKAELFELKYFDTKAYLAQSPQLYKQMAMTAGFDKVFEIAPAFRADPSFTSRHATEFTSVDIEMSWINSHEDIMNAEEEWLAKVFSAVAKKHGKQLKDEFSIEVKVPKLPIPRLTLAKAKEVLASKYNHTLSSNDDLDPEGERLISQHILEKLGSELVFITDYPKILRPFYHMRHDDDDNLTKSFDLLFKGVEIATGAQREHRVNVLVEHIKEKGMDVKALTDYINFFKYGCPPHGGFGFGLTRLIMQMLGLPNIREATYLFRGPNRLRP